jgi:hypothetical protein
VIGGGKFENGAATAAYGYLFNQVSGWRPLSIENQVLEGGGGGAVVGGAAKEASAIWSATKNKSAVDNAFGHWSKHKGEFPELANSKQYVDAARSLAAKPPADAFIKSRGADTLIYDKATNTFLVKGADGAPRTMFRPNDGINYWNKQ